jgi:hypothetical protein
VSFLVIMGGLMINWESEVVGTKQVKAKAIIIIII